MARTTRTDTRVQTGFAAGTRVMTFDGPIAVDFLEPGDRVITRRGVRILRAIHVREQRDAPAVVIRASALGHGRPARTITVAAGQPMLVRDWRARTLFGEDQALVRADRLADGTFVTCVTAEVLRTFALAFDQPEVVYAEGTEFVMDTAAEQVG
ncbi:Hint domain-containing protein [Palleronia rufa]|uniref:Hint domain-containing protein n=1 Tax=Palleronia rufa TaxID=1530186 RepID=UPI0005674991|nr:Hint domain-containing protein [Palleronia rufa]